MFLINLGLLGLSYLIPFGIGLLGFQHHGLIPMSSLLSFSLTIVVQIILVHDWVKQHNHNITP